MGMGSSSMKLYGSSSFSHLTSWLALAVFDSNISALVS